MDRDSSSWSLLVNLGTFALYLYRTGQFLSLNSTSTGDKYDENSSVSNASRINQVLAAMVLS
jgi:hypothetical protein